MYVLNPETLDPIVPTSVMAMWIRSWCLANLGKDRKLNLIPAVCRIWSGLGSRVDPKPLNPEL